MTDPRDTMRWVRRGVAIAALLFGWLFIASQNHFHITPPMVIICLGYLAVVATIYNLWRTGAVAVDASEDEDDSTWAQPAGQVGELEREKRTLLKAIKEAEFDHQMGKLSQHDADEMIRGYRSRAIEVIKDLERLEVGAAGSVREQILREVRARVLLESKAPKAAKSDARGGKRGRGKKPDAPARPAAARAPDASDAKPADAKAAQAAKAADEAADGHAKDAPGATDDHAVEAAAAATAPDAASDEPATDDSAGEVSVPRDEELDADSTTALEPRAEPPAKEATR